MSKYLEYIFFYYLNAMLLRVQFTMNCKTLHILVDVENKV